MWQRKRPPRWAASNWLDEDLLQTRLVATAVGRLICLLQIPASNFQRILRVVIGLQCLAIFVGGALALSRQIEDHAQLDVTPNLGPARFSVAIEGLAISIRCRLIVVLQEEDLG